MTVALYQMCFAELMAGVVLSLRMEFVNGMSASFAGQCFDLCRVGVQTLHLSKGPREYSINMTRVS